MPDGHMQLAYLHITLQTHIIHGILVLLVTTVEQEHLLEMRTRGFFTHSRSLLHPLPVRINHTDYGVRVARAALQGQVRALDDVHFQPLVGAVPVGPVLVLRRLEFYFDVGFALHLRVGVDGFDGEPVVLVVVGGEVLALDGHFSEDLVLFEVPVAVEDVDGDEAEVSWHFELEFFPEEGAGSGGG